MSTHKSIRKLPYDITSFLKDYNDAVETDMHVREFCAVTGILHGALYCRIVSLANRGILLRPLRGMRQRTKLGRLLGTYPTPPAVVERAPEPTLPEPTPIVEPPRTVTFESFEIIVGH